MAKPGKSSLVGIPATQAVAAFERLGFSVVRQKGSHIVMSKPGHLFNVVVPAHRPVSEGTLKQCIRAAGITPAQFMAVL